MSDRVLPSENVAVERVVNKMKRSEQAAADLAYWLGRPMAERIAAVEVLRQQAFGAKARAMLNSDFKEFAELLNANAVEYLVVGGYALAAHGHPRYTGDIDFWVSHDAANIERLLKVLQAFGFGSLGLTADNFDADTVVQLGQPPRRIDLLTGIDGVDFAGCWSRRETVSFDGLSLNLIGLEDFKANKRAVGRLKDLADLEALRNKDQPG